MSIEQNVKKILNYLNEKIEEGPLTGQKIAQDLDLKPVDINTAIEFLHQDGLVEWFLTLGTAPFHFYSVKITAKGQYELQREQKIITVKSNEKVDFLSVDSPVWTSGEVITLFQNALKIRPPIGSPYGFTPIDWEYCASKQNDKNTLNVVVGSKFESPYFSLVNLRNNVELMFRKSLERYNRERKNTKNLNFICLHGGLGEHLFNEIARDIISSDIAVFETSDQAANVYLEIGVALTYGVRVLLLKNETAPKPASDISGQTYVDYKKDAGEIVDRAYDENLFRMVERAIENK